MCCHFHPGPTFQGKKSIKFAKQNRFLRVVEFGAIAFSSYLALKHCKGRAVNREGIALVSANPSFPARLPSAQAYLAFQSM